MFVGRNGAGKSNILHAIEFFYTLNALIEPEDFHAKTSETPIEITVTFTGLSDIEKKEFASYIMGGELTVKKVATYNEGTPTQKYYASSLQHPAFTAIRNMTDKREQTSAWNNLIESETFPEVGVKVKRSADIEPQMEEYEAKHPELLVLVENEHQFFGPTNVGGGKLDNHTKFVMVPAVREVQDEIAGKKGAVLQLLDMIVRRKVENRQDVIQFRREFEERIKALYSSANLTELPALAEEITKTLNTYAPGVALLLDWAEPSIPMLPLPNASASLQEDGFQTDIRRKGHGLQRALILSLLQYLAGAKPFTASSEMTHGDHESESLPADSSLDLILAIEEPELYQHPLRSRFLCEVLCELSHSWEKSGSPRNQVIYTTHSPYFIALDRFNNVRRVLKCKGGRLENEVEQSFIHSFTLYDAAQEAARVTEQPGCGDFTAESFLSRARPVMNTIVNEGFFADVVLVVEGNTEYSLFWGLQAILGKEWHRKGIAVVPAFGKNNVDRPVIIFRGLRIPTYFVFDADSGLQGKKAENEAKSRNKRYMQLSRVPPEDFPTTRVEDTWAVFEDKIETTIKGYLGADLYAEAQEKAAEKACLDSGSDILKNFDGASSFLEYLYAKDVRIPILESIVEKVEELIPGGRTTSRLQ
jgi:predicted ATP-dependent endonuclease of OLD family